jgi:hypothetical protein
MSRSRYLYPPGIELPLCTPGHCVPTEIRSRVQSYLMTDGQSASLSWYHSTIWDPRSILLSLPWRLSSYICGFFFSTGCPLWREDRSVITRASATGHCQRCHSRVQFQQNLRPYLTVSFETFYRLLRLVGYGGGILTLLHTGWCQWLRLALSSWTNRVRVFHPLTSGRKLIKFPETWGL